MLVRVTIQADLDLDKAAELLGCSRSAVVDCLLRGLTVPEILAVVRVRLQSDADARAAWSRGRS